MNLYKCDLTIYVLAESKEEAQNIAVDNCDNEDFSNWESEKVEDGFVSGLWGKCLPYITEPNEFDDLTCNQFLERNQNASLSS